MKICNACKEDLDEILKLQYLAYQSEAELFKMQDIPPLKQTLEEVEHEYETGDILKMVAEDGTIIGSVRANEENGTVHIGKLMVHPEYRCLGHGTALLKAIEELHSNKRFELFTSTRSVDNIKLYEKCGYKIFGQKEVTDELTFVYMEKC